MSDLVRETSAGAAVPCGRNFCAGSGKDVDALTFLVGGTGGSDR